MTDGLYQVTVYNICAGFVVKEGKVIMCAPVLRKKLAHWLTIASAARKKCVMIQEQNGLIPIGLWPNERSG